MPCRADLAISSISPVVPGLFSRRHQRTSPIDSKNRSAFLLLSFLLRPIAFDEVDDVAASIRSNLSGRAASEMSRGLCQSVM